MLKIIAFASFVLSAKATVYDTKHQNYMGQFDIDTYLQQHDMQSLFIVESLKLIVEKLPNFDRMEISKPCATDLNSFVEGLKGKQQWALQMLDSYGKPGSGLSDGNGFWVGSYDLCRSVIQQATYINRPFHGKYCWYDFPTDNYQNLSDHIKLHVAVCVPNTCSTQDLNKIIENYVPYIYGNISHYPVTSRCLPTRSIWNDPGAVVSLCFCIFLGTILLAATIYDIYTRYLLRTEEHPKYHFENSLKQNGFIESNNYKYSHPGLPGKILLCFSLYTNGKKLFSLSKDDRLTCINGIRVFSITWIILGHTHLRALVISDNILRALNHQDTLWAWIVKQGYLAVDSFFVLSGVLVTYIYLRENQKRNGNISWLHFYLHRYWRLTPVYAAILFLFVKNFNLYIVDSPFATLYEEEKKSCEYRWWMNLVYINNYGTGIQCMGRTWYLAVDMQCFILSPIILIFLKRRRISVAIKIGVIVILLNSVLTPVYAVHYNLQLSITDIVNRFEVYRAAFQRLYTWIAPYVIGMACGYMLFKDNSYIKMNKRIVIGGWIFSLGSMFCIMFIPFLFQMNRFFELIYISFSRSLWAAALSWLIYACSTGHGGVINSILSWRLWEPLARLSYSVYLFHSIIIEIFLWGPEVAIHASHILMINAFVSSTVCSFIAAILVSLSFEAPFIALEKLK